MKGGNQEQEKREGDSQGGKKGGREGSKKWK